jgi:putative DNA primase/helicase
MNNDLMQEAIDAMRSNGLNVDNIKLGKIIRFNPTNPRINKNKSGWYIFNINNDILYGAFGNYSATNFCDEKFTSKKYKALPKADREAVNAEIKKQQEILKAEIERQHQAVAVEAEKLLALPSEGQEHEYLSVKNVSLLKNTKIIKDTIHIPLCDYSGKLWNWQRIYKSGDSFEKRYFNPLEGYVGRKQGCFYPIIGNNAYVLICEGYSTGATLHKETGYTVICAMDCHNIVTVYDSIKSDERFKNSEFIICADNDHSTNPQSAHILKQARQKLINTGLKIIEAPRHEQSGYDFNDMHNDGGNVSEYINDALYQSQPLPESIKAEYKEHTKPFQVLGMDSEKIYFLSYRTNRIFSMTTSEMTEKNLYKLAPKSYWDSNYAYELGKRPDMLQACDDIIQEALSKTFFDFDKICGRGVWNDKGNIVLNTGDSFYENGIKEDLQNYKSKNFYVAGKPFDLQSDKPTDIIQNKKIREIFDKINLKNGDLDRELLFGWCIASQISGILKWRSHLWVSGASGSGKSEVQNSIVAPLLGSRAIYPEAGTTEAGIRQALASDSLSVIYEEAEANSQSKAQKIEAILELARTASSSSKRGTIYKGSAGGAVTNFKVRSCFYFTAIQPSLQNKADISRVSVIEVIKDNNKERYAELCRRRQFLTDDVCDSFFMWIIKNAKIILKNIDLFCPIVASLYGGNARNGDQIGTLLACAWTATNGREASKFEAEQHLLQFGQYFIDSIESQKDDSESLHEYLMEQHVEYETMSGRKKQTIGTLLAVAGNNYQGTDIFNRDDVVSCLAKYGFYAKDDFYGVKNHQQIRKWLKDSSWSGGFMETLKRFSGCKSEKAEQIMVNHERIYVLKFCYTSNK